MLYGNDLKISTVVD